MIKSFSLKKLVERLQQGFPSKLVNPTQKLVALLRKIPAPMLLLAIAAHGLLLFIPFSSSKQKSQAPLPNPDAPKSLELIPTPEGGLLFNPATSLVQEKKPVDILPNPVMVSKLPPIPTDTSTNITLPPTTSNIQVPPPPPPLPTGVDSNINPPPAPAQPTESTEQTPPPPSTQTPTKAPRTSSPKPRVSPAKDLTVRPTSKPQTKKKAPAPTSTTPTIPTTPDTPTNPTTPDTPDTPDTATEEKPDPNTTEVTSISTGDSSTPEPNTDNSGTASTDGDLPKYANTQTGSFGLLPGDLDKQGLQTTDKLADVVNFYEKELATAGYEVKILTEEQNLKIYQVSKGSQVKFLHIFEQEGKGTVILFADKQIDPKSLNISQTSSTKDISVEEKEFDYTLNSINEEQALKEKPNFAEPDKFATTVPGIKKILGTSADEKPEELAKAFTSKLEAQGFKISPAESDGSGLLYEVKKGDFTQFINFVPTADGKGTNVVVWEKRVRS